MRPLNVLILSGYPPGVFQYCIEKALRELGHGVFTAGCSGPLLPEMREALDRYDPGYHYDLTTDPDAPLEALLARCPFAPDLILHLETALPFLPTGLVEAPCPTAAVFSEDLVHADWYTHLFPYFDLALCTWKSTEVGWRAHGHDNVRQWYFGARPPFCVDEGLEREWDVAFIGNLNPRVQRRRLPAVQKILRLRAEGVKVFVGNGLYFQDYNRVLAQAKIVYHRGITDQVNMRVFEAMGAGCLVVMQRPQDPNDPTTHFFRDREEVVYCDTDDEALALIRLYLRHDTERRRIAKAGREKVMRRHGYADVVRQLLTELLPTLPADYREQRRHRLQRWSKDERRMRLDYARYYLTFGGPAACHQQLVAIPNHERDPQVLNTLGMLCAANGQPETAVNALRLACALAPDAVLPRVNLAALGIRGNLPDADAWFAQATARLDADPAAAPREAFEGPHSSAGYDRFRLEVAHVYFRHPAGAERHRALARLYRFQLEQLMVGHCLDQGRFQEARDHAEAALAILPDDGYVVSDRARAHYGLGDVEAAIADFRRAIDLEPFFLQAQNDLALCLEQVGELEEALARLQDLAHHSTLVPPASLWQRIGALAQQLGRRQEALEAFQRALALLPEDGALQAVVAELVAPAPPRPRVSVVLAVDDPRLAQRAIAMLQEHTPTDDRYELLVIRDEVSPAVDAFLRLVAAPLIVLAGSGSRATDYASAAAHARGDHLIFLDAGAAVEPDWLDPLVAAAADDAVAVPCLAEPEAEGEAMRWCFCLRRELWERLGGLDAGRPLALALAGLRERLQQSGGALRTVSESVVRVDAPARDRRSREARPRASIIILAWNQLEYTRACVASVLERTRQPYELILVDNGSTDGTLEFFRSIPGARVVANGANLGFAAGNNRGITVATGDYIVLLNNDTLVTEGWLDGMIACAQEDPAIGIVGPMSNSVSGAQKVEGARYDDLDALEAYARAFGEQHRGRRLALDRIVGFCMLITRRAVSTIGLLDERFGPGNFEDDDYCLRAKLAGFRLVVAGDVFIHHFGGRTFHGAGIDFAAAMTRGMEIFMDKWNGNGSANGRPADVQEAVERGRQRLAEGRVSEATGELAVAVEADPGNAQIWNDLACAHAAAGRNDDAERCLKHAAAVGSVADAALAARNLGALYCQQGRWQDAIAAYQEALKREFDLDSLLALSQCCLKVGAGEAAVLGFRKILEAVPNHPEAQAGLVAASYLTRPPQAAEEVVQVREAFHRAWYDGAAWTKLEWFGVPIRKNPFDLLQYQEIITQQRPDFVIECGAFVGGSTLYFAHLLDLLGHGRVISIELAGSWLPAVLDHPRVIPIQGSSVAPDVLQRVRELVRPGASCFVILDSDHRAEHVLAELRAYAPFVQVGNYLVVEDSNINGHPVLPGWGPGPWEAVQMFLQDHPHFVPDREREEKLLMTFAPSGWLRRMA